MIYLLPCLMLLIFLLSNDPNSYQTTLSVFGEYNDLARKSAHVIEFFLLTVTSYLFFRPIKFLSWSSKKALAISFPIFFAFLDEIHQYFIPGRVGSLVDVGIDCTGVFAAILFITFVMRIWR